MRRSPSWMRLAGRQLVDAREAAAAQPVAGAAGHDDPDAGAERAQRRDVQVVAVQVADQDEVDAGPGGAVGQRHDPAEQADGGGEQGVGEHGAAGQLDADGRVAQEVQLRARHARQYRPGGDSSQEFAPMWGIPPRKWGRTLTALELIIGCGAATRRTRRSDEHAADDQRQERASGGGDGVHARQQRRDRLDGQVVRLEPAVQQLDAGAPAPTRRTSGVLTPPAMVIRSKLVVVRTIAASTCRARPVSSRAASAARSTRTMSREIAREQREEAVAHAVVVQAEPHAGARGPPPARAPARPRRSAGSPR